MSEADCRKFLRDLGKKRWTASDRLRANLNAAVDTDAVLGLIFLKYVSDAIALRQRALSSASSRFKSFREEAIRE